MKQKKDRKEMLATDPLGPLLARLSIPAMISMLVMASYNVVDTIFVGWGVGPYGIAATASAAPLQFFVNAISMWFAVGTASLAARSLGAGDQDRAERALANGLTVAIIAGFVSLALGLVFLDSLITLTGSTDATRELTKDYLRIVFLGNPLTTVAILFNNSIRAEGDAKYAMGSMIIPAVLNAILDPLFIFGFHMGIKGAAWATVTGHIAMLVWNLCYYLYFRRSLVALNFQKMGLRYRVVREIVSVGLSEFARQGANCVCLALLMNQLARYGTAMHMAAYGILGKVTSLTIMPVFGLGQGMLPIVGYCWGAGLVQRARKAIELTVVVSLSITVVGEILILMFPQYLVLCFTNDPELIQVASRTLRIALLAFALLGIQNTGTVVFQALGFAGPALFLSLCRQVIFMIPAMILLPLRFGVLGIFLTYPTTDVLAFFVTVFMLIWYRRRLTALEGEALQNR